MKRNNAIVIASAVAALPFLTLTSQAALLVEWGRVGPNGQSTIVTGNAALQNVGAVLGSAYGNPNVGDGGGVTGYYAGSADPSAKNPVFYAAQTGNLQGAAQVTNNVLSATASDGLRLGLASTTATLGSASALYFWGQSMVYSAATVGTPSGYSDAVDYGFQNGLNSGNIQLTSIGGFAGVGATSGSVVADRTLRFVILQGSNYYVSASIGGITGTNGNGYTYTSGGTLDLDTLTWASFDPTTSIVLAGSETFSTLTNYNNIKGVGVLANFKNTTANREFYVGGFSASGVAVPEPNVFALLGGTFGMLMFKRRRA